VPNLSESRIRAAKPAAKPYKLFDERGLFLLVTPAGGRLEIAKAAGVTPAELMEGVDQGSGPK
jgi:hypothetical protein